jgi:hypothetical protein
MQRTFCSFNHSYYCLLAEIPTSTVSGKETLLGNNNVLAELPSRTNILPSKRVENLSKDEILETLLGDNNVLAELPSRTNISPSKRVENPSRDEILESLLGDNDVLTELENRTNISPSKRPRRSKGQGSGYFITRYAQSGKYGNKYPQTYYQVEFGKLKRSIFIAQTDVGRIMAINAAGEPIQKILEAISSPKAKEVAEEYRQYLLKKLRRKTST